MTSASNAAQPSTAGVTIVTQTRVAQDMAEAFASWQRDVSAIVAAQPGFIEQTILPPNPPTQLDWVILQRFARSENAVAWLRSDERARLVAQAQPLLVGQDDVHLLNEKETGVLPAPASAVISTRIRPGQENAYREWERRIAAAQARAPGFQGYRFEPPVAGVQDDWLAILRFDSEANLQAWLASSEREKLLEEAGAFTEEYHARIVHTGFDQWFQVGNPESSIGTGLEAEHGRADDTFPRGRSFQSAGANASANSALEIPTLGRSVYRQRGECDLVEFDRAVGKPPPRLVATRCGQRAQD